MVSTTVRYGPRKQAPHHMVEGDTIMLQPMRVESADKNLIVTHENEHFVDRTIPSSPPVTSSIYRPAGTLESPPGLQESARSGARTA